jgi:hypothetical protein
MASLSQLPLGHQSTSAVDEKLIKIHTSYLTRKESFDRSHADSGELQIFGGATYAMLDVRAATGEV